MHILALKILIINGESMSDKLRARFESIIKTKIPSANLDRLDSGDFAVKRGLCHDGDYNNVGVRSAWEGFQLGYKAGIEAATKVCVMKADALGHDEGTQAYACAEAIRQLGGE